MAHWFKTLFAETGTKTAVPNATDPSGFVSYNQGYGADYQRVLGTDPLAKGIERDKLNQVLYDMTGALQQYQTHGFPDYIDATANGGVAYAYAIDAIVLFTDGKNYVNTVAANTSAPNISGWIELGSVSTLIHNMTSDANYTLTVTENKYLRINITDTSVFLTAGRNIVLDNSQRRILVVNNTLQTLTFKTSAGTGIAVSAGVSADLLCDGTNIVNSITQVSASSSVSGVRQTVQTGSVDTNGFANFISIGTGLNVNIAATTTPIKIHAAGGVVSADRLGTISADTTLLLGASVTSYIYGDVATNGVVTLGSTTLTPIYQFGGTPSVTNGQFTYNISEGKAYRGNGTTAPQVYSTFIGEAITSGVAVTSVVTYALNGMYDSGYTATIPALGTQISKNHNLGLSNSAFIDFSFIIKCLTAEHGFAIGESTELLSNIGTGIVSPTQASVSKNTMRAVIGNTAIYVVSSTGAPATPTSASWAYRLTAYRGW